MYAVGLGEAPKKKKTAIIKLKLATKKPKKKHILVLGKRDLKLKVTKKNVLAKHKENLAIVMKNSNATPIRKYGCIGYACCFCPTECPEPLVLKQHTLESHVNGTDSLKILKTPYSVVKLDITDLECKICFEPFEDLQLFIDHLITDHEKNYNSDVPTHMVPFKFESDLLVCVFCKKQYGNFKVLLEHMGSHYENFVCDVCGKGFISKQTLLTHMVRHRTGVFICEYCQKTFNTRIKQKEHERAVHICHNKRSRCGYCGEKFSDYTKKNEHVVKIHGGKPLVLQCQACQKTFDNQRALNLHTKSVHLMERRIPTKK